MTVKKSFVRDGKPVDVRVEFAGGRARVHVGEASYEFGVVLLPAGGVRLVTGDGAHTVFVAPRGRRLQVRVDGVTHDLELARGRGAVSASGSGVIDAPMTGTVLDVPVKVGDAVTADATVVVLNAMKMEHKLRAGVAGVVKEVSCKAGEIVDQGRVLVRVEAS
jgi:3-methylcrotonyl-CoA carboxylase alpha subunit